MKPSVAILLSGLAAQQVSATWNRRASHFNTPEYNNNECSNKQKEGYNWQDVPKGSFSGYDDFNFKGGWTCADSFGKRDTLTKRTFNSKCVKNKVAKEKPASFDCSARKEGFSVKEIQVSVEFDCDLEFHYKMPDKSICKQVAPCKKDGTIVQNTQCGGAQEVDVYLGNHGQKERDDCEIGLHHIEFDCNPGYTSPPSSSQPPETSTPPPVESSSTTPPAESATPPPVESSTTPEAETSTPSVESSTPPPEETPTPTPETPSPPPATIPTLPPFTNSTAPPVQTPASTPPAIPESSIPPVETPESSTIPPVETPASTPLSTPESSTTAPEAETSISVVVSSSAVESSSAVPPPPSSSTPPGPPGGFTPPECLPKCMNTWLEINTKCKDNTDSECYCKNPEFTKSVIDCVAAWATDSETQEALQYLIGICATHIPENPGLITDCPTYIPLNPTTPPATTPPATGVVTTAAPDTTAPPAIPVTTITYDTTVKVPCSCAESTEIESTTTTTITVPQVIFTTETPAQPPAPGVTPSDAPVVLVPGTPPPVPAQTTAPTGVTGPPYPTGIPGIPTSLGTVTVPSGSATFSSPAQFTGAASVVRIGSGSALFGSVLAFFAL